jgi:hypothetical protein
MAKAAKKPSQVESPRKDEPDRCSVSDAFNLMLPQFKPYAARARLEMAILTDEVHVWCNDNPTPVSPGYFADCLRLSARADRDGHWTAGIGPIPGTIGFDPGAYVFSMSRAEIEDLLLQDARAKRGAGGPTPKYDHNETRFAGIDAVLDAGGVLPRDEHGKQTFAVFCERVVEVMQDKNQKVPGDTVFKEILRPIYKHLQQRK